MTGAHTRRFNLTPFLSYSKHKMHILTFNSLGIRKLGLLHKAELHVYFCNNTTLIGPLSGIRAAGIVQVLYD